MPVRSLLLSGLALLILQLAPGASLAHARVTWVVRGAGFGHGVGMSAYGAYGFALHGYSHQRILGYYFPGTRIARRASSRRVRVLLRTASGDVSFRRATTACGRTLRASRTYRARRRGSSIWLVTGSGRAVRRCGSRLVASGGAVMRIGGARYRGSLIVARAGGGTVNVINQVPVDDYVRGVLPGELYPSWPAETLEAFAVAMRSIALTTDVGGRGFELYPDTRTQVYKGRDAETPRTDAAARATAGRVLTYGGRTIQATYYSSSGGRTESRFPGGPRVPYLRSLPDPYDRYSPLHRWTKQFSQAEIDRLLGPYLHGSLRRVVVTQRGDSPRILQARLVGTRGTTTVTGQTLRAALGLYDTWASFRRTG